MGVRTRMYLVLEAIMSLRLNNNIKAGIKLNGGLVNNQQFAEHTHPHTYTHTPTHTYTHLHTHTHKWLFFLIYGLSVWSKHQCILIKYLSGTYVCSESQ